MEVAERLNADTWKDVLQESRDLRESLSQDGISPAKFLLEHFSTEVGLVSKQIQLYKEGVLAGKDVASTTKETKKSLTLSVRNCLRFGISLLSVNDEESRHVLQDEFVCKYRVHLDLGTVISSQKADTKTRQISSRFLCNLVTRNAKTSYIVLSSMDIAPESDAVQRILIDTVQRATNPTEAGTPSHGEALQTSWLDILISSGASGNRELMGTVVAVLYNSLSAIPSDNDTFSKEFTGNGLIVSTLLRHILSSKGISTPVNVDEAFKNTESLEDEATEWISNLLMMFVRRGYLMIAYESIGPVELVLPEQVAFLFCLRGHMEQVANQDELFSSQQSAIDAVSYLAIVYSKVRLLSDPDAESEQKEMAKAVQLEVMEILANFLGNQTESACAIRKKLGTESSIVYDLALDLGMVYDVVALRNDGKVAREMHLSTKEQRMLILLVRALGNLAFECRHNQDLIRTVAVPRTGDKHLNSRTCLHLIISTTSLAYKCFTLREWGLVALRYLMESNEENQKFLAELEAQQPVQSAELNSLGIRVDMDQKGNVKVVPIGEKLDSVPE